MAELPETMRDRGRFWTPAPDWSAARIKRAGWSARRIMGLGQTLVSGAIEAAVDTLAHGAAEVGLWGITDTDRVLVRIARDRGLLVTPEPITAAPGWNAAGFVATPADDGWAMLEIAGEGVHEVISEGTAADLETGSRSASVLFAGVPVLLYRADAEAARLHVEAPLAAYLWTWLEGAG